MKRWAFLLTPIFVIILTFFSIYPSNVMADDSPEFPYIALASFSYSALGDDNFIEIRNLSDDDIHIDEMKLLFYNTSHNLRADAVIFPEGTLLANGSVVVKEEMSSLPSFYTTFKKVSASAGAVRLIVDGETMSSLCWGAVAKCINSFNTVSLTASANLTDGYWTNNVLVNDYAVPESYTKQSIEPPEIESNGFIPDKTEPQPEPEPEPFIPQYCSALRLSEISTNDQWIELYNVSDLRIAPENLVDCVLAVQYGDKMVDGRANFSRYRVVLGSVAGWIEIAAYNYLVLDITQINISLPKNVKDRAVAIFDDSSEYDEMLYSSQKANTTQAYFADGWKVTYAPTPGAENVYQKWQTCEAGKHINETTGNCVKDSEPPVECAEGQYRNPETGRCKKYTTESTLADCAEGQYRNPLTNRCKKIASDDELSPCAEGYERNPETNRCRKIVSKADATYSIDPYSDNATSATWAWLGGGGLALAGGLITWQFRPEISQIARRASDFFGGFRK